ncbi:MAG: TIGR04283 family arsenosugar biosynthesis glycosyltransferase [Burkholderiales bacterium]
MTSPIEPAPAARPSFDSPTLAIVMPVLDEGASLTQRLAALKPLRARGVRVVVVDGGSGDDSLALACTGADLALIAPRGRASQMNAGAGACDAELLLFLHADTQLPERADELVRAALAQGKVWGRFDVRIDSPRRLLATVAGAMNLRSRLTGIATGDQAIFMRRGAFDAVGGFPALPLMEDIAMSRRLKRLSGPACLRETVLTSARRWEQHGAWRTIGLMWRLRAAHFLGADPDRLAQRYDDALETTTATTMVSPPTESPPTQPTASDPYRERP